MAAVAAGATGSRDLAGDGRQADAHTALALVRHLAESLQLDLTITDGTAAGFHPTRTAQIKAGPHTIGHAGELHPLTIQRLGLEGRVAAVELDLIPLLGARRPTEFVPVSPYPPADFDLSFELDADTPAGELEEAVRQAGGELVENVAVFDQYTGPGLEEGRKALALRIRLRAPDRTLRADEISAVRATMITAAGEVGAALRGAT